MRKPRGATGLVRRVRVALLAASLAGAVACGGKSGKSADAGAGGSGGPFTGTGGQSAGAGGAIGAAGGAGGTASSCPPAATYGGGEPTVTGGRSVTAVIVDETGAPVGGQPVFIGGLDITSNPGTTGTDGYVSIATALSMKKPAFKYGDNVNYAELAIPLTMAATDFTGGNQVLATGKLSDKPGAPLTPGTVATSGDVSIALPAGSVVGIDTLVYDTAAKQQFRAVNIPVANAGPVLDPVMVGGVSAGFALLYGVAPAETTLCPPVKVTVVLPHQTATSYNDLGWAPGTAVELWIMTTDVSQTYAPYAGWAKMSDGVVSSDGTKVATADGAQQGFIFLDSFAIRKTP